LSELGLIRLKDYWIERQLKTNLKTNPKPPAPNSRLGCRHSEHSEESDLLINFITLYKYTFDFVQFYGEKNFIQVFFSFFMKLISSSFEGNSNIYLDTKISLSLSAMAYSTNSSFALVTRSIPTGGLSSFCIISFLK